MFRKWRKELKEEKKLKKYQHIDRKLDLSLPQDFSFVVKKIRNIEKHQFLPFIKRVDEKIRYRKKKGKKVRTKKNRELMYACHLDAHIYSYYNFLLSTNYEKSLHKRGLKDIVTAYRTSKDPITKKGKSNIEFSDDVAKHMSLLDSFVVITQDIEGFFDNISHKVLKEKVSLVNNGLIPEKVITKILNSLTKYKYIKYNDFVEKKIKKKVSVKGALPYKILEPILKKNKSGKGIPQGSPISGLLANISLVDFDKNIKDAFPNVFYRRYSDDLIFICKPEEKSVLLDFIFNEITSLSLRVNPSKTFVTHFKRVDSKLVCTEVFDAEGKKKNRRYFDYLGFEFSGDSETRFRKSTIGRLKYKLMRKIIKQNKNQEYKNKRTKKINSKDSKTNNYIDRSIKKIDSSFLRKQGKKIHQAKNTLKSNLLKEKNKLKK